MIASSSIYGQALLHFSEEFEPFSYFNMDPQFNDNYIPVSGMSYDGEDANYQLVVSGYAPMGMYLGIFQNDESGAKDSNGNIANYDKLFMWAEEKFNPAWFIEYEDIVYRIIPVDDYRKLGGLSRYGLEKLIGSDGQGTTNSNLNNGSNNLI